MSDEQFEVLSEQILNLFFRAEPTERETADGFWLYQVPNASGVQLRFSFNIHERSVQTTWLLAGRVIINVSCELADRMWIDDGQLRCEFLMRNAAASLRVAPPPELTVTWCTLRSS